MTQTETRERPVSGNEPATRTRTQTQTASTLVTEQGITTIASDVVAKVAGIAAREIDGIHHLVSGGAGGALSDFAQRVAGTDSITRGVSVEVGQREAAIDLRVITVYGASIPDVAQAVRQNIINRVREMTGLHVTEVNIDVIDMYFPGEEREREREPEPQEPRQEQPTRRVQ